MIEDDDYRASSQYRYWSYTKASLDEIRRNTNTLAAEKVKAAFRRARTAKSEAISTKDNDTSSGLLSDTEIQTLTVDEELKIVQWGCSKIVEMGSAIAPPHGIPANIVVC